MGRLTPQFNSKWTQVHKNNITDIFVSQQPDVILLHWHQIFLFNTNLNLADLIMVKKIQ